MKNLIKFTLVVLLLTSCKEAPKSSDSKKSKIIEGITDEVMSNNVNIDEKYALLMEELKTKTLLTDEQLLEAYPKKLGNFSLDTKAARITSSKTVMGNFGNDAIQMEILDAGGENVLGAIIPLKMLELNKITSEYNNTIRYSKKEHNGILIFGTDRDKDTNADFQSELRFLYDNRFYVTLECKGMDTDALWDAFGIENLQKFKAYNK
jgi:hypothetical protein